MNFIVMGAAQGHREHVGYLRTRIPAMSDEVMWIDTLVGAALYTGEGSYKRQVVHRNSRRVIR